MANHRKNIFLSNRADHGPGKHEVSKPTAFYKWLMRNTIGKIRNKERMGFRGEKKRYSVFRAEQNQKWSNFEEEELVKACEKHGLDITQFFDKSDNPNRKWREALDRFRLWEKANLGKWPGNMLDKR